MLSLLLVDLFLLLQLLLYFWSSTWHVLSLVTSRYVYTYLLPCCSAGLCARRVSLQGCEDMNDDACLAVTQHCRNVGVRDSLTSGRCVCGGGVGLCHGHEI